MAKVWEKFSVDGKIGIVSGCANPDGIGRGIVDGLVENGAKVLMIDVQDQEKMDKMAAQVDPSGKAAVGLHCDISDEEQVKSMVQVCLDKFGGRIDFLFNNAGALHCDHILDFPTDAWRKVLDINVTGYFMCLREVGKVMVKQKSGSIINTASMMSFGADRNSPCYPVTKAGVMKLTECAAVDLGAYNVRVNAFAPGWFQTNLPKGVWDNPDWRKEVDCKFLLRQDPGKVAEWGHPKDIVGTALFLASDASEYLTGITIKVDGGWWIGPPNLGKSNQVVPDVLKK